MNLLYHREMGIPLTCALPCRNQHLKWPQQSQLLYLKILSKAQNIVYVHNGPYNNECMQKRNIWMVDHCDKLISVHNGKAGGTKNCVDYAVQVGKPIININPNDFKIAHSSMDVAVLNNYYGISY